MSASALSVQGIETLEEARELAREWSQLWERCPYATVFQCPEWILAAWRHLAPGVPRLFLAARSGRQLVALLPLRQNEHDEFSLEGAEVSDYLDVLVEPAWRPLALTSLLETLAARPGHRQLHVERLEAASPLLAELPIPWTARLEAQDVCPFVPIPAGAKQLSALIPSGFLRRVRQSQRVAERHFRVDVRTANPNDVEPMLERLIALHASRWNARGHLGVFAEPAILAFHREVVPRLLEKGQVWLLELQLNDQPAAAVLVFCARGRALFYIGGFAHEFDRFSPGRLLLAEVFERALRESYHEVDFLRGVERYKYDWGAQNRSTRRLVLQTLGARELRSCRAS